MTFEEVQLYHSKNTKIRKIKIVSIFSLSRSSILFSLIFFSSCFYQFSKLNPIYTTWTINIPTYTANNGVQPESGNPTNFELGGSIIKSTFIDVGPSNSGHDLQFDSNGPLGGSGKIKFTATTGTYSPSDKLVRFEASGAISAYVIAAGTNGTGIFIQSTSSGAIPMIISNSSSAEIFRMLNSGQLQLNLYNTATAFQGSSGTSVGVLNVDNTGKLFVGAGGGGDSLSPFLLMGG
jgi:hypothetical protein